MTLARIERFAGKSTGGSESLPYLDDDAFGEMKSPVLSSLRAMLVGSVDYAGLFPPAALGLEPALENHSAYVRGDDAWMLGRFVLPTGKFAGVRPMLDGRFDSARPLRVSALGSKALSTAEFLNNLRTSLSDIASHRGAMVIDQFEASLPSEFLESVHPLLQQAGALIEALAPGPLQVFWEVPFSEGFPMILRDFARHGQETGRPFGVKLRTGGTEAAAFPSIAQLADALLAARDAGVALKFTAGLHHPVRHFNARIGTHMHGFLNLFAAAILAREHRLDAAEIRAILEDERPESFRFDAEGLAWRERRVPTSALAVHRQFVTSFGSCSFDEPRDDLRRLGMMA